MSDTTRLGAQSGVAKSDDVNRLRAIMQMNIARAGAGQVGVRGSHGSVFRQSEGFRTKGYSGRNATLRTFFVTPAGADVVVSAGAINNVAYAGGTLTAPANGDKVYIDATISGTTVTAVTVSKAASVPADTSTHIYTLLAAVAVASSVATVTPVAWNYSQLQICAGQGLWGGFGA